jgi:hypothetical protein
MKWLYIYGVDGLSVSGGGTIDGSGQQWWASTCKRRKTPVITDQPVLTANHLTCLLDSALFCEFSEPVSFFAPPVCSLATRGLVQR